MIFKESLKRKAITPVISTIILIFITLAVIGMASQFIFTTVSGPTEKAFDVPPNSALCKKVGNDYYIDVYVKNAGIGTLAEKDFVVHEIDGVSVPLESANLPLEKGSESKKLISYKMTSCSGTNCLGLHSLTIGTSAGVQQIQTRCS